jgi:lipid-A-disaccharide synthase
MNRFRATQAGVRWSLILPNERLVPLARAYPLPKDLQVQVGGIEQALQSADLAIASTGTVTLECAYFGVPTVAIYKTSPPTYWIAKRLAQVKYLAMPNLLVGEEVFPEFIQNEASAENVTHAAMDLLNDRERRRTIKAKLAQVIESLGPPGASARAAEAIVCQLQPPSIRASLT